ncbi:nucleotidyl transferase AbiEii/AbiGii toxin family protein [Rhodopseudomonas sp. B29]|uniref:nucleotidyl transferase AbiEii/AbiGii toxin family protein n=1 Tax=Rhodopseudomonas sp. B29 TaxID=95607 RepID=UPI0003452FDA|nr:nucleotidyl transferase AbiEii/AbiGii toxin family protein [Rhodopseudomonas sp. B29]
MTPTFEPRLDILPPAQRQVWPELAAAVQMRFVLYGGTAVALHLGHRISVDFDFFASNPLDKPALAARLGVLSGARTIQDEVNTLVVEAQRPAGVVKLSFFGGLKLGRINPPMMTTDGVLLVASPEDLLATKLKATLDRAEAKDYRDIAALLSAGISLPRALGGFQAMFGQDAGLPLRAIGYFKDGDLPSLSEEDRSRLRAARDAVADIPEITLDFTPITPA